MLNTLLFVHFVIALLLIIIILLQNSSTSVLLNTDDKRNYNIGIMSRRATASFLTKATIIVAIMFFINAIVLGNLCSRKNKNFLLKLEKQQQEESDNKKEKNTVPIAQ